MKIAVIADLHAISPREPLTEKRVQRAHFGEAWPSFKRLCQMLRKESPDLIIHLGDMVDWYSPENRDFALDLFSHLPAPWVTVPGNHDYESYEVEGDKVRKISAQEGCSTAKGGWLEREIELHNRYMDVGDAGLILLDSATSGVPEGTEEWLAEVGQRHSRHLLFTHVPVDLPEMEAYILGVDPKRNMNKYVQRQSPWVAQDVYRHGVTDIFTGHLHFPGYLHINGIRMHMLGMSIDKPGQPASASIIELDQTLQARRIYAGG